MINRTISCFLSKNIIVKSLSTCRGSADSEPVRFVPKKASKFSNKESIAESSPSNPGDVKNTRRAPKAKEQFIPEKVDIYLPQLFRYAKEDNRLEEEGNSPAAVNSRVSRKLKKERQDDQFSSWHSLVPKLRFADGADVLSSEKFVDLLKKKGSDKEFSAFPLDEKKDEITLVKKVAEAKELAVKLLNRRSYSKAVLRQKLVLKNFSEDVAESAIVHLENCGLINDAEYAESFARTQFKIMTWGPHRIQNELWKKGVSKEDSQNAILKVFNDVEDAGDADSGACDSGAPLTMSGDTWSRLLAESKKVWERGSSSREKYSQQRKMVGWLTRRGFDWDVIQNVLKRMSD